MITAVGCRSPCGDVTIPSPTPPEPWPAPAASGGGAILTDEWAAWTNITVIADPGNGRIVWNNADQANATALAVAAQSSTAADSAGVWRALRSGDILAMQRKTDADRFVKYRITGTPIDHVTWFEVPVSLINSSGLPFTSNETLVVAMQ